MVVGLSYYKTKKAALRFLSKGCFCFVCSELLSWFGLWLIAYR